jgi:hypothetical protein
MCIEIGAMTTIFGDVDDLTISKGIREEIPPSSWERKRWEGWEINCDLGDHYPRLAVARVGLRYRSVQ